MALANAGQAEKMQSISSSKTAFERGKKLTKGHERKLQIFAPHCSAPECFQNESVLSNTSETEPLINAVTDKPSTRL